ncbi:hypothetical protein DRE_04053 [Drechslerella stenobrocha 248]|uniref:Heterokaryon incompatibility domain-containing protein n=1 Tax=Drechslerella stenobrocha 248 TaxID=1043628 RepID=W7I3M3_9PEZI|nr:hypothetical protein DRE_04053 [Drechslerella stenobrocha 248]
MEHLLSVPGAPEIIVPYLGGELFEDYGEPQPTPGLVSRFLSRSGAPRRRHDPGQAIYAFKTYFHSRGFQLDMMNETATTTLGVLQTAQSIQISLYFAPLICIFRRVGIEVTTHDFIRVDEKGNYLITTRNLPGFIERWIEYEESNPQENPANFDSTRVARLSNISEILGYTSFFSSLIECARKKPGADSVPLDGLELTIMAMGETMCSIARRLYGDYATLLTWGPSRLLLNRLRDSGWCPSDRPFFPESVEHTSICADYYFGGFACPRPRDHTNCTEAICTAFQEIVDEATYKPVHVEGCPATIEGGCMSILAPPEVVDIVRAGDVPVVSWDGKTLRCLNNNPESKYVSISHVWSDGLGNDNKRNYMHQCQLSRIQSLVDALYPNEPDGSMGFWIDTLCVPVGKENVAVRRQAIAQMANVYRQSDQTLVLDSFILRHSRDATVVEKYIAIHLSNWHHRLWTLQEGQLGKALYFQFQGGAQSFQDMRAHATDPRAISTVERLSAYELERFYRHFENPSPTERIWDRMRDCAGYLRSRETSRKEDEPLCVSTILGLDPYPLFAKSGLEDRMTIFYDMIGRFDPRIIFNEHAKLDRYGYGWAPRSFLHGLKDIIRIPPKPVSRGTSETDDPDPVRLLPNGGGLVLRNGGFEFYYASANKEAHSVYFTVSPDSVYITAADYQKRHYLSAIPVEPWWLREFEIKLLPTAGGGEAVWKPNTWYAVIVNTSVSEISAPTPAIVCEIEGFEEGECPVDQRLLRQMNQASGAESICFPTHNVRRMIVVRCRHNATINLRSKMMAEKTNVVLEDLPSDSDTRRVQGTVYSELQKWCIR